MGRTTKDFVFSTPVPAQLTNMIHSYLMAEGCEYKNFEGEIVYQKGEGMAIGPTFFKIMPMNNVLKVEAWMKNVILPGVFFGEISVDSFYGWAVKGPLKDRFSTIVDMVIKFGGQPVVPGAYQQPMPQQMPQQYQQMPQQQYPQQFQQMPPQQQYTQQYQQMPQQQYPQQYQQAPAQYPPQQYGQPYPQSAPQQMPAQPAQPAQPIQPVQSRPERVRKVCAYCGAVSEDGMKFCMSCGSMLE